MRIEELAAFTAMSKRNRAAWNTGDSAPGGTATSDLLLAGMPIPIELYPVLAACGTDFVPLDGIERLSRGSEILAAVDVPVFIGVGDRDIMQGDPREIPSALPSCADITLFVLADAGHNQNVAPNREQLWDRISASPSNVPTPEWHREVVRERLASHRASPDEAVSWDSERRRIAEKLDKSRG